ncbi:MAG: hypothetical protein JKY37_18430 [Nannocystaceae bacterium]|nr:hypothetical protein [Nannocystaceae bacterium]
MSRVDPNSRKQAGIRGARWITGVARPLASPALGHLRLALAAYRLDTLDGVKTRASRRALLRATDLAVEIGRWAGAPLLVVEAALASPKPRRHQRALRSRVDELTYLSAGSVGL